MVDNYVKDIENKSNLNGVENLDNFDFVKFDKDIESSFQNDFLAEFKIWDDDGRATEEQLEKKFNGRLDLKYNTLDTFKNDEISQNIIKPTVFDLQNLSTLIELSVVQEQIQEQKEQTKKTGIMKLGEHDFSIPVFGVTAEEIAGVISDNNFTKRREIIKYLEKGEVDEIQNILKDTGYELGIYGDNKDGVDNRFGTKTLAALQNYVKDKKIAEGAVDESNPDIVGDVAGNGSGNGVDSQGNAVSGDGTTGRGSSSSSTSTSSSSVETTEGGSETDREYPSSAEIGLDKYGGEEKYTGDLDSTVELAKGFTDGAVVDTMPYGKKVKLEDGKLKYDISTKEETFRVSVVDKDGKKIYNHVVSVSANMPDGSESDIDNDGKISEYEIIMTKIKKIGGIEKQKDAVVAKITEKREKYIELEQEKQTLTDSDEDQKRMVEIKEEEGKIKILVHDLLVEEAMYELKNYLNKNHGALKTKLNDNCNYYIGGKYLERDEFVKRLKKGEINLNKIQWVGLDVTWNAENETYFTDIDQVNKDFVIENLTIADDTYKKSKSLTRGEQIQYKTEGYVDLEKKGSNSFDSERRALKHILGIKGLFGRGGVDDDMSISTEDYETNNPILKERRNLRKLKRILLHLMKDDDVSIKESFEKVNVAYEKGHNVDLGSKDLNRLFQMYTIYRDNADGIVAGGDYFQKAMGLLDNYFIKGVDDFDDDNSVLNIYNREHIGRFNGLIDPDKQKKAVRQLFRGDYFDDYVMKTPNGNDFPYFENSSQLKKLKRMVKKIDLVDYFHGGNRLSGKYARFDIEYRKYETNRPNGNSVGSLDKNGNVVVMEGDGDDSLYYNAVFDFLVGIGEGKQDIVESVNSMKILEGDNIDNISRGTENEEMRYTSNEEKQFVMALADLNSDGRSDFGDRGMRMGLEIKNIWKSVAVDAKYLGLVDKDGDSNTVYGNLIEFSKYYMEKTGQNNLLGDLNNINDVNGMVAEIKTNPGLLNSLQNILVNSPIPMDYILRYGKDASEVYLESDSVGLLSKVLKGKVTIDGLEQKLDKEIQALVDQGLDIEKIPELRTVLKPIFYGAVINNGGINYGGAGGGLTLNTEKIGSFSLNLGITNAPPVGPSYGVTVSWAKSFDLSSSGNTTLDTRTSVGTSMLFVPIISQYAGVSTVLNMDRLNHSINAGSIKKISLGGNVSLVGGLPTRGLSAGFSQDKLEGINLQYSNIKNKLDGSNGVLAKVLSNVNMNSDRMDIISELELKLSKGIIGKELNDLTRSDRLSVSKAAEGLFQGISYYDLKGSLDSDDPRLTEIIHDMTENYALQWKNDAIKGAGSVYLDSAGVGVQFLAGYLPVPVVGASVSWNKNLYSTETNKSVTNYYAHLSTGKGMNRLVGIDKNKEFMDDKGNITDDAVDYLNAKMNIAHPDIEVSDLDIKIDVFNNEDTSDGEVNKALYIPKNLYKYVNVNIDSGLRSHIAYHKKDGIEYIVVPLNTKIALLDYSRTNTGRFNLIIGDTKAGMDDIQVGPDMDNFDGDPTTFESVESYYMDENKINNGLNALKDKISRDNVQEKLPLTACKEIKDGSMLFDLDDNLASKCVDMGGTNSKVKIVEVNGKAKLMVPENGTLTIYKNDKGEFEMYYSSILNQGLTIEYKKSGYTETVHTGQETEVVTTTTTTRVEVTPGHWETIGNGDKLTYKHELTNLSKIDIFDQNESLSKIFKGIEKKLSKMDDKYNSGGPYASLMNAVAEAGVDNILDGKDYDKSVISLKKILESNSQFQSETIFDALRKKLDTQMSTKDKVMIVDRFKAIFSYHIDLTDRVNNKDGDVLTKLVKFRIGYGDQYKKLTGYDKKTKYPLSHDYRGDILDNLKGKNKLDRKEINNLIGFTAFYRLGEGNKGRGYSMTQMGSTNVLDGKLEKIDKGNDLGRAKEWFWNNLNASKVHKDLFKKALVSRVKGGLLKESDLTDANLKKILSGENIDINGGLTSIKLRADYVFYLLGECANESIGLHIQEVEMKTITRIEKPNGQVRSPDTSHENHAPHEDRTHQRIDDYTISGHPGGDRGVNINPEKTFVDGGLYSNMVESQNELARAKKGSAGIKLAAAKIRSNAPDTENDNQYTDDGGEIDNQYGESDNQHND